MITRYALGKKHLEDGIYITDVIPKADGDLVKYEDYADARECALTNQVIITRLQGEIEEKCCTCPSGDGSLNWPCPTYHPEARLTPEKLRKMAEYCDEDAKAYRHHGMDTQVESEDDLSNALRQAADDAERLDWCEANPEHPNMPYFEAGYWWMPYLNKGYAGLGGGVSAAAFDTLREAIDTARKEPK